MEKNIWEGRISLPETYTQEGIETLVKALALYLDDLDYLIDVGETEIAFDPQGPLNSDGLADYYDETAVVTALAALHAKGYLEVAFLEGNYERTHFEGLGDGKVRVWQGAQAFKTAAFPEVAMIDGTLFELEELEGGRIPDHMLEEEAT